MANPRPLWQYPQDQSEPRPGALPVLPRSMKQAVWLMAAGAGISIVYNIVNVSTTSNLITFSTVNPHTGAFATGEVFGALIVVALWLWMLWKVRAGRPW